MVGHMALNDTLRNLLSWTLSHRVGDSSPSPPTNEGESEFNVQTLDVVQTLNRECIPPNLDIQHAAVT